MVRQALTVFTLAGLGIFRDPGCGGVDEPKGRSNAPCTRTSDCGSGLVCSEGVCREPDAGTGGSSGSGSGTTSSSGGSTDASTVPVEAGAERDGG